MGGFSPVNKLRIIQVPEENNSATQILVRRTDGDPLTEQGEVQYIDVNDLTTNAINNLQQVYISSNGDDNTGLPERPDLPFLTIDAGLIALGEEGGIVNIGIGTFNSPNPINIKNYTIFKGSGKPNYNNTITGSSPYPNVVKTTATKLVGGTILNGTFRFPLVDFIHVYDLGVDCGPDWVNDFNDGEAAEGFMMSNDFLSNNSPQDGKQMRQGVIVKNISVIVNSSADLVHSFAIENCYEPYVDNINTYNGFAGFVYKNIGGSATNIKSSNSSLFGIIVKTNSYAYNNSTILNGFEIDGGAGLTLHDEGDDSIGMNSVYITNGRIRNTTYGLKGLGNILKNIHITNIDVQNISGKGYEFTQLQQSNLIDCNASTCSDGGFSISSSESIRISECRAFGNTTYGFNLNGTSSGKPIIFTGNDAVNNSTYGFSYSGSVVGGHNTGYGNTTALFSGTISIMDASASPVFIGAPGGFQAVLTVENTGSASQADKNIAGFIGNRGNASNIDDNSSFNFQQKSNISQNYFTQAFFNSGGGNAAVIATRFKDHSLVGNTASLYFFTALNNVLGVGMVLTSLHNLLIGKDEYTGSTNNDNGDKLQVAGNASVSGNITAASPILGAHVATKDYVDYKTIIRTTSVSTSTVNVNPETATSYRLNAGVSSVILPELTGNEGVILFFINNTSSDIPLDSNSGGNDIWSGGSAVNTEIIPQSTPLRVLHDGTQWVIL